MSSNQVLVIALLIVFVLANLYYVAQVIPRYESDTHAQSPDYEFSDDAVNMNDYSDNGGDPIDDPDTLLGSTGRVDTGSEVAVSSEEPASTMALLDPLSTATAIPTTDPVVEAKKLRGARNNDIATPGSASDDHSTSSGSSDSGMTASAKSSGESESSHVNAEERASRSDAQGSTKENKKKGKQGDDSKFKKSSTKEKSKKDKKNKKKKKDKKNSKNSKGKGSKQSSGKKGNAGSGKKKAAKRDPELDLMQRYDGDEPTPNSVKEVSPIADYPIQLRAYTELATSLREQAWDMIVKSQNPPDCEKARTLTCETARCGFGCQLHHYVYCLMVGVAENRVVHMKGHFSYADSNCKDGIFCYLERFGKCVKKPKGGNNRALRFRQDRKYLYFSPSELRKDISRIHPKPALWFAGVAVEYFLRPNNETLQDFADRDSLQPEDIPRPLVGIHVRHGDKAEEAGKSSIHTLSEYISFAKQWGAKSIYIATDDKHVVQETRNYPEFTWLMGKDRKGKASGTTLSRKGRDALVNLLYDMHKLSGTERFVGTSTSQISRTVYELMNYRLFNAVKYAVDLDYFKNRKKAKFWWYFV